MGESVEVSWAKSRKGKVKSESWGGEGGREETFKILKGRGWWYCDGTREVVDVKLGERLEN